MAIFSFFFDDDSAYEVSPTVRSCVLWYVVTGVW